MWNGKEIGQWQIHAQNKKQFREIVEKLLKLGFVYTNSRINTVDGVLKMNALKFPYITIGDGCCSTCKMTLNGYKIAITEFTQITSIDDWIANYWPAYDAA